MRSVSKKLLSVLLVALLLVSVLPQAFAVPHDNVGHPAVLQHNETTHWYACQDTTCDLYGAAIDQAAHTGNPCSVCGYAPAVVTVPHDGSHVVDVWTTTETEHWRICRTANCEKLNQEVDRNIHTYNNGVCTVCGYAHTAHTPEDKPGTAVAATCTHVGKNADKWCQVCHAFIIEGSEIPMAAHTFPTGSNTCSVCGYTQVGAAHTLTLDANGGTVNGGNSMQVTVHENSPITVMPDPVRPGYTFAGWVVDGINVCLGGNYPFTTDKTAVAHWTEQTYPLTIRMIKNGDASTAQTLLTVNVPAGTALLAYLNGSVDVNNAVQAARTSNPGYTWQGNYWYDFSGTMPLTNQTDVMNRAWTVYVNFVSTGYTLYFNPNGGTVSPTSKAVSYGQTVGTLPTPTKAGSVFQGWKDANGNMYTAATVYNVAGDTSLTAVWSDEALVLLRIYINGDTSTVNRIVVMDGYVVNNNISRANVVGVVSQYYAPVYGTQLSVAGLFDDGSWASYRANTNLGGVDNIQITSNHVNNIYVMVKNANIGQTYVTTGTGTPTYIPATGVYTIGTGAYTYTYNYGTGTYTINGVTYYGTNPKTGDDAMIETAIVVMVMAAASLAAVMYLNFRSKRKAI